MTNKIDLLIKEAYDICVREDRSIEYTTQFIMDYCHVNYEKVMKFLNEQSKIAGL